MRNRLARLLDSIGAWCFMQADRLSPQPNTPTLDAIMAAVTASDWRRQSTSHPEQAAVRLVESTNKTVYLAPTWALYDRQCFVVENNPQKTEWRQ